MNISRRDFLGLGVGAVVGAIGKSLDSFAGDLESVADVYFRRRKEFLEVRDRDKNIELMTAIMYAEAARQSSPTRMCVGEVVLNRVEDSRYPSSVEDVIIGSGEFDGAKGTKNWRQAMGEVARNGYEDIKYNSCVEDAKRVLSGNGVVLPKHKIIAFHDDSLSYEGVCGGKDGEYWKGLVEAFSSDSMIFYKDRV